MLAEDFAVLMCYRDLQSI